MFMHVLQDIKYMENTEMNKSSPASGTFLDQSESNCQIENHKARSDNQSQISESYLNMLGFIFQMNCFEMKYPSRIIVSAVYPAGLT